MKSFYPLFILALAIFFSAGCGKGVGTVDDQQNQAKAIPDNGGESLVENPGKAPSAAGDRASLTEEEEGEDDPFKGLLGGVNDLLKGAGEIGQEIFGLSVAERRKVGKLMHEQVIEEHDTVEDSKQLVRIKKLAEPFMKKVKGLDLAWEFRILKSDTINAFSHVGGYIYFNTALLDAIESDAELQFIIGHEVGHVLLKHCAQQVAFSLRAREIGTELGGELGGTLAGQVTRAAYATLSKAYDEDQEFASDKWSYETMKEAGHSRQACLAGVLWLQKREAAKKKTGEGETPGNNSEIIKAIENHFRTHPPADERLARLKKLD